MMGFLSLSSPWHGHELEHDWYEERTNECEEEEDIMWNTAKSQSISRIISYYFSRILKQNKNTTSTHILDERFIDGRDSIIVCSPISHFLYRMQVQYRNSLFRSPIPPPPFSLHFLIHFI